MGLYLWDALNRDCNLETLNVPETEKKMLTEGLQIAERAKKFKGEALTNLQQFITDPMLTDCFNKLNKKSSAGVDGMLWDDYNEGLEKRLFELLSADFLGFTHYLGKSRKGFSILKRKTSKKKFRIAVINMTDWIKKNMHSNLSDLIKQLNVKLRGHLIIMVSLLTELAFIVFMNG